MPGSTRSYEFATRLAKNGNIVHMITSNWQGKSCKKFRNMRGVNVHLAPVKYSNKMGLIGSNKDPEGWDWVGKPRCVVGDVWFFVRP